MTVTADALGMLAGDPARTRKPGDFHRHPTTGAPYVAHPTETNRDGTPKRVMYGRPSSFGSALDNPYNLLKWKERQLLMGARAINDRDGFPWDYVNPDDRNYLDALAADCYDAAETSLAADRGTHIHLLLERFDRYEDYGDLLPIGEALGIPTALQIEIVTSWAEFRAELGVTALGVEMTVVNDGWRLAGTLDRLDVLAEPLLTAYGVLEGAFIGDIKTGGLTLGNDGQPNYWVKYPVQLAAYVDAVPYDTDTDLRSGWWVPVRELVDGPLLGERPPNPDIALIYHYDLARALNGEKVAWQAIPVNVQAGRDGGNLCRQAADFAKRRDLFAMPAPTVAERIADIRIPQEHELTIEPTFAEWIKVAVPTVPTVVEQPAQTPQPPTASSVVAGSTATNPDKLRARIAELVTAGHEQMMRNHWPEGVPTLKHGGHSDDQLSRILAAVRSVEALAGMGWHPDDGAQPVTPRQRNISR